MNLWTSGNFDALVREVRFIQSKLKSFTNIDTIEHLARKFNDLMLAGKINPALRLLSDSKCSGILPINDETKQLLRDKHPPADEKHDDLLLEGPELRFDEYAYEGITGSLIRKIARERLKVLRVHRVLILMAGKEFSHLLISVRTVMVYVMQLQC